MSQQAEIPRQMLRRGRSRYTLRSSAWIVTRGFTPDGHKKKKAVRQSAHSLQNYRLLRRKSKPHSDFLQLTPVVGTGYLQPFCPDRSGDGTNARFFDAKLSADRRAQAKI